MKRIILTAFTIFIFPLLLSNRVFAYTDTDVSAFIEQVNTWGYNISDANARYIINYWENSDRYMYSMATSTNYGFNFSNLENSLSGDTLTLYQGDYWVFREIPDWNTNTVLNVSYVSSSGTRYSYKNLAWGKYEDWKNGNIDFENVYYSPAIPLPEINVYFLRPYITPQSGIAYWCSNLVIGSNTDYYVQYGYKITIPTLVGIGLDSTTGNYTYSYDQYNEGSYIDIAGLQDMQLCNGLAFGVNDVANAWQSAYDDIKDSIPEFYPKIAYWANNTSAPKYLEAQDYYKNYMMTILPMYGNRLEYFARLFTVQDGKVTVGDWVHWSSASGSKTQEKPTNYVDQTELPGTVNTNNNVDLPEEDNTYNSVGTPVGNQPTIINNNYAPNYPDYPTVVTYNHDNVLLNSMDLAKQLPSYFGEFGSFLTSAFIFIPNWIWILIGTGFAFSIVIMIIKVL